MGFVEFVLVKTEVVRREFRQSEIRQVRQRVPIVYVHFEQGLPHNRLLWRLLTRRILTRLRLHLAIIVLTHRSDHTLVRSDPFCHAYWLLVLAFCTSQRLRFFQFGLEYVFPDHLIMVQVSSHQLFKCPVHLHTIGLAETLLFWWKTAGATVIWIGSLLF